VHSVDRLESALDVYNIEVHGEHVFRVTADGVLVHNAGPDACDLARLRPSTLKPGPFAVKSIPGHLGKPTTAEQKQINDLMNKYGCHTCGTTLPGTKSGNAIVDHQPPQALADTIAFFPHCIDCMRRQGGETLKALLERLKTGT